MLPVDCRYWLTNNFVTTLSTVLIRKVRVLIDESRPGPVLGCRFRKKGRDLLSRAPFRQGVETPEFAPAAPAAADPPKAQGFGVQARRFGEVVETTDAATGTKVTIKPPGVPPPASRVVDAEVVDATTEVGAAARKKKRRKKRKSE